MLMFASKLLRDNRFQKAKIVRTIAQDSKRSFWALADQGVVSLGNFGMNIVLARHFAAHNDLGEYGAFWVLMELMFFLNGVQGALIIYPLTVRGAALDKAALGKLTSQSLILTLLAAPLLMLSLIVTAAVAQIPIAAGFWAGVALLFWQLQETSRRALMAHLRFRAACVGDAISYAGQVAAVIFLSRWAELDLEATFQALAITFAAGCLMQSAQVALKKTSFREILNFGQGAWGNGQWILFGNLTNLFSGALFNWNFAYWVGMETLGVYYALYNLIRPAHPLTFAVSTLITPNAAKVRSAEGVPRARTIAARFILLGAILLTPYLGLLLLFPKFALAIFYGWQSPYMPYSLMVQLSALAVALVYLGMTIGAFLNAIECVRQSFVGQVAYAAGFLLIVMPLTAVFGLRGAICGWLIAAFLRAAVNAHYATLDSEDPPPAPAEPLQAEARRDELLISPMGMGEATPRLRHDMARPTPAFDPLLRPKEALPKDLS